MAAAVTGLFLEDVQVGREYSTPSRTITGEALEAFLASAGIADPLHRDDAYARAQGYRGRLVPGLMAVAVVQGLIEELGLFGGTLVAYSAVEELKFLEPVYPGDSLRAEVRIAQKRATAEPTRGAVLLRLAGYNQAGVDGGPLVELVRGEGARRASGMKLMRSA